MHRLLLFIFCFSVTAALASEKTPATSSTEMLISVADQKLVLLTDGDLVNKYPVSTSRFGLGDSFSSYKTPVGKLRICQKIGAALNPGTVLKNRTPTKEIIPVNAPGRDPIVTRILWLEGMESQNHNARARGIYIHGTPEERTIGAPKSWGCIRMRSNDVMELFSQVPVGTGVTIIPGHLPRLQKHHVESVTDADEASNTQPIWNAMKKSILMAALPATSNPSKQVASNSVASAKQP